MKKNNFKELSVEELNVKISEFNNELANLKIRKKTGQVEKPHKFRHLRQDIARLHTVLNTINSKNA